MTIVGITGETAENRERRENNEMMAAFNGMAPHAREMLLTQAKKMAKEFPAQKAPVLRLVVVGRENRR